LRKTEDYLEQATKLIQDEVDRIKNIKIKDYKDTLTIQNANETQEIDSEIA